MSRNLAAENAALRARLRRLEEALRATVAALEDDPTRAWLTAYLSGTMKPTVREPEAAPDHLHVMPEAGTIPNQE